MTGFTHTTVFKRLQAGAAALFMAASLAMLPGCNQQQSETNASNDGELAIGLTDAQGDFVSYTVAVKSIELTKANGAVVETVPLTTDVDFAQLTDMTEFLTAGSIPKGVYTSAKLTLDYSNADIQVEAADGSAVSAAHVVDSDGNALQTIQVSVKLDGRNQLTIVHGVPASLTLDFDLAASNTVAFDGNGEATVTVEPYLVADLQPHAPKIHRVRGALQDVDTANSQFDVIVRPFAHAVSGGDDRFGTLTVNTQDTTVYDINGVTYEGAAGLTQLASLQQFTAVVAIGDLKFNPRRFEAREVHAGSSVAGGTLDAVTGTVLARAGDVLTVQGATLIRADGSVIFNDHVTVQLDAAMKVRKQFSKDEFSIDAISVGQRVTVFGTLTDSNAGSLAMNGSYARMLLTKLRGTVVTAAPLVVDVQSIDARPITMFDFTGTGTDAAHDADAANYEVDTLSLSLANLDVGTPIKVLGFVTPFGQAPVDFVAQTVVDVSAVRSTMNVVWTPATAQPYSSASDQQLVLDLNGSPLIHHVGQAGVLTDLTTLGDAPTLLASAATDNVFMISQNRVVQLYNDFASFVQGIQSRVDRGLKVKDLHARGDFNESTAMMTTHVASVRMQ